MLYALIGSLLAGSLATVFTLWRKAQVETELKGSQGALKVTQGELAQAKLENEKLGQAFDHLKAEYNSLVDHANAQIKTLQDEKEGLLNELAKSGKPGVFGELLRSRNTTKT